MVTTKVQTGLITFWSLCESFNRQTLQANLHAAGFPGLMPDVRANVTVLRDALTEAFAKTRVLVRPLAAKNGFAVVREDRGADENAYAPVLTAKVFDGRADPVFAGGDQARIDDVTRTYHRLKDRVTLNQVTTALIKGLDQLRGTRLRPSGGVYWLPGDKVGDWQAISQAFETAAEGRAVVYRVEHDLSPEAVVAIRDGLVGEVMSEARRLHEEIMSGELGDRALETRKNEAAALRDKVSEYERILGVGLAHLKKTLDSVEQTNATAAVLLAADPFGALTGASSAPTPAVVFQARVSVPAVPATPPSPVSDDPFEAAMRIADGLAR